MALGRLRIGTRGSKLALAQAQGAVDLLGSLGVEADLIVITTSGDRDQEVQRPEGGLKGMFVKEIHKALSAGEIDAAIHSLKDVPAELEEEFVLAAVPVREDPRDAWISGKGMSFADILPGSKVGTTSLRRQAQLKRLRKDLELLSLRGNVDTRLRKLKGGEGGLSGTVLALAGLKRLGLQGEAHSIFGTEDLLPAAAQGALGITSRRRDSEIIVALAKLDHRESREAVLAERAFLSALGADCNSPVAALALIQGGDILLTGLVAAPDGSSMVRLQSSGGRGSSQALGSKLAKRVLQNGGREILKAVS